jgi:hypothetical protein
VVDCNFALAVHQERTTTNNEAIIPLFNEIE